MKRVLVYSHDTFGLGNIRRMLELARHLVHSSPQVQALVITGTPALHTLRLPERVDCVKLPCLARDAQGRYAARSLPMPLQDLVRLRAHIIRATLAQYQPHLVLVDKKPFGVQDELAGALQADAPGAQRPPLVLLLRDILDSPQATQPVWQRNGYFDAIASCYRQVLVVGCPSVYDLGREYAFPPAAAAKLHYCGYMARPAGRQGREAWRSALGVQGAEPLLLCTPGGGEDGAQLVDTTLAALALLPAAQVPRTHVVCGPEMPAERRAQVLRSAARLPRVSVQEASDDMMGLMAAADLVLAMGGYNTVCELLTLRRRAVLLPRVRPGVEQCLRAERMAARGLLRMVHPDQATPQRLLQAVQVELGALASGQPLPPPPRMDGLAQVSAALLGHLGLEPAEPGLPLAAHPGPGQGQGQAQGQPAGEAWA